VITKDRMNKMRKLTLDFELAKLVLQRPVERGDHPSYCTFAGDIMPLAFEHDISLIKMLSGWRACTNNGIYVVHYFDDESPLRAIVCCLILVLQAQK